MAEIVKFPTLLPGLRRDLDELEGHLRRNDGELTPRDVRVYAHHLLALAERYKHLSPPPERTERERDEAIAAVLSEQLGETFGRLFKDDDPSA